jgi:hypothetical protein
VDAHTAARGPLTSSRHFPALFAYGAITVALTWPLAVSLGDLVPEDLGDPLLTSLILWWNAQQLPFTDAWWSGTFFFPGTESLALSDHRVGLGLFTTPLIWLGASPLTAYDITFLLTWWLSAAAAYALVWTLTANRAAAFIGGLIFGFNPFRAGHLAHLELLASYWLPVILIALHQWLATRRGVWLVALSVALLLQALTSGYYFFFMAVFVALWLLWFARGLTRRDYAALVFALAAPLIALAPVLWHYRQAHSAMGLRRSIDDIQLFSADVTGWLTAPERLALWNTPDAWRRPEGELMPGLVAVLLVVTGAVFAWRSVSTVRIPAVVTWLRRVLLVVGVAEVGVAILPWFVGPIAFTVAGIHVSTRGQDKPLAVAFLCAVVWLATSRRFVAAFVARSRFAYYVLVTGVMFVLTLGPEGRLMGHPVLYKAPYAWLMLLPGFADSFRAPSRFAMLAVLALSVAAGLALVRLAPRVSPPARGVATAAIIAAIIAESWIHPIPLSPAPSPLELPAGIPPSAVVLELPVDAYEDALAMFRTTVHHRRTINGLSGYIPAHYQILANALFDGDADVLTVVRRYADIVVVSRRDHAHAMKLTTQLRAAANALPLPDTATHLVTLLEMRKPPADAVSRAEAVRPAAIATHPAVSSPQLISDDDYQTAWSSVAGQTGTEMIAVALSEPHEIVGLEMASGPHFGAFARELAIDVSEDGEHWKPVAAGDGASAAFEAAMRDAKVVAVTIRFEPQRASHVRIRQTGRSRAHWAVAELRVLTNNK